MVSRFYAALVGLCQRWHRPCRAGASQGNSEARGQSKNGQRACGRHEMHTNQAAMDSESQKRQSRTGDGEGVGLRRKNEER